MSDDWYDCKLCGGRHDDAGYDVCPGSAHERLDAIGVAMTAGEARLLRLERLLVDEMKNRAFDDPDLAELHAELTAEIRDATLGQDIKAEIRVEWAGHVAWAIGAALRAAPPPEPTAPRDETLRTWREMTDGRREWVTDRLRALAVAAFNRDREDQHNDVLAAIAALDARPPTQPEAPRLSDVLARRDVIAPALEALAKMRERYVEGPASRGWCDTIEKGLLDAAASWGGAAPPPEPAAPAARPWPKVQCVDCGDIDSVQFRNAHHPECKWVRPAPSEAVKAWRAVPESERAVMLADIRATTVDWEYRESAIRAALAVLEQAARPAGTTALPKYVGDCNRVAVSSRTCERGTNCCTVTHGNGTCPKCGAGVLSRATAIEYACQSCDWPRGPRGREGGGDG